MLLKTEQFTENEIKHKLHFVNFQYYLEICLLDENSGVTKHESTKITEPCISRMIQNRIL